MTSKNYPLASLALFFIDPPNDSWSK